MSRLSWLGHQSRLLMALATVWRVAGAGVPMTGHLLMSPDAPCGAAEADFSWADNVRVGDIIMSASSARVVGEDRCFIVFCWVDMLRRFR
jgi:hypothetical protein